jgi:hypothetical protein
MGEVYFGSQFQRVQPVFCWPCLFGPVAAQYIMVGAYGRGGLLTSWGLGSRERDRKKPGFQYPL